MDDHKCPHCGSANIWLAGYDRGYCKDCTNPYGYLYESRIEELEADRDRWKARAEALKHFLLHYHGSMCVGCSHYTDDDPGCNYAGLCENYSAWEFDEARFKEGE